MCAIRNDRGREGGGGRDRERAREPARDRQGQTETDKDRQRQTDKSISFAQIYGMERVDVDSILFSFET